MELKHQQQTGEANWAYFFQVLSEGICKETLLFTEAMKLNYHKNGLGLPAKADQWSSFKTPNGVWGRMCPVIVASRLHPLAPVNNPSLFSLAPPEEEEAPVLVEQRQCSVGALVNPFSSQLLKRAPSCYYSSGHNVRGVFVSFALLVAEITGSISALWKYSQVSGSAPICRDMNIR